MKNRFEARTLPTLLQSRAADGTVTDTWSSPATYYDQFQVLADYTGPRKPDKYAVNPHAFLKTVTQDYVGAKTSTSTSWATSVQENGRIMSFSRTAIPGGGKVPGLNSSVLYNRALSKLYDKVRGDVDWAVNAAEAKQTIAALREYRDHLIPLAEKLAGDASKIVRFVRRFHPKQWGRRWLEYQYGWKPLATDMYGTMQQMLDFTSNHIVRCRARASQDNWGQNTYDLGSSGQETVRWRLQERCEIKAVFVIPQSRLVSAANYMSLNPVTLAWELTTASFVVDWFINVGGFLRNMESALLFAASAPGGYVTHTSRCTNQGTLVINYNSGAVQSFGSGDASMVQSFKTRTETTLFPSAPVPECKLGWERLFSAASLLSLFVSKGTGPR